MRHHSLHRKIDHCNNTTQTPKTKTTNTDNKPGDSTRQENQYHETELVKSRCLEAAHRDRDTDMDTVTGRGKESRTST